MTAFHLPRLRALLAGTVVLLTGLLYAPPAAADFENDANSGQGIWPSVSVNVTYRNGILVAEGLTMGGAGGSGNRVLWRTPLARGVQASSIQHGATSTFVQTRDSRIVIDNATGRAYTLANNQVWRRLPSGQPADITGRTKPIQPQQTTPVQAPTGSSQNPVASAGGRSGSAYSGGSMSLTPQERGDTTEGADTSVAAPQRSGSGELSVLTNYQLALRDLMNANNRLATRLDRFQRLQSTGSSSEVDSARKDLEQARVEVAAAQQRANALAPVDPAASQEPVRARAMSTEERQPAAEPQRPQLTPQQYATLRDAEQRVLDLTAQMNRKAMHVSDLRELGEMSDEELAQEQKIIAAYQREIDRADLRLAELRMEANRPVVFNEQQQQQADRTEREITMLNSRVQQLERQLRTLERQQAEGLATEGDLQRARNELTEVYQALGAASEDLMSVHRSAFVGETTQGRETEAQPATVPAAWPRLGPPDTTSPIAPRTPSLPPPARGTGTGSPGTGTGGTGAAPGGGSDGAIDDSDQNDDDDLSGLRPSDGLNR